MFERLMVALDGSESAELVLPYVEYLAREFKSEVDLVGVCEQRDELERLLQVYLDRLASQMSGKGVVARPVILYGQPATEIIGYGEKNDIGMIIMAARGRSGITRWDLGSVADKVLKASTTPLLLIRTKLEEVRAKGQQLIRKILVPLDGSKPGEAALPYAMALASGLKAEVLLLQVVSPAPPPMAPESYYAGYTSEIMVAQQAEAENYLKALTTKLFAAGLSASHQVVVGTAADKILETMSKENISLIGMSTHGRTGLGRWVYGSVAGKILSAAPIPVLLVRARK